MFWGWGSPWVMTVDSSATTGAPRLRPRASSGEICVNGSDIAELEITELWVIDQVLNDLLAVGVWKLAALIRDQPLCFPIVSVEKPQKLWIQSGFFLGDGCRRSFFLGVAREWTQFGWGDAADVMLIAEEDILNFSNRQPQLLGKRFP